jgi:hypothetical protein
MEDPFARLRLHMDYSQTIGAPVEQLPDKIAALSRHILQYLIQNTANAREGILTLAGAYLSLSMVLEAEEGKEIGSFEDSLERARHLITVVAALIIEVNEASENTDE